VSGSKYLLFLIATLVVFTHCFAFSPPYSYLSVYVSRSFNRNRISYAPRWSVAKPVGKRTPRSLTLISVELVPSYFSDALSSIGSSIFNYNGNVPFLQALGLNALLFAALNSKLRTMLTPTGFAHSMALGTLLWTTLGWRGWTLCVAYLFLGQIVTKVKFSEKEKRGLAESRGGRRGPENVWGSAATGLACAACSVQGATFLGLSSSLYLLGYVASLATKLADTFASEIGKAYGKTTFLITSLKRVEPGTEGAVSAEGTAAAVLGGLLLSSYGYAVGLLGSIPAVAIATVAAFVATNIESLLGATLQEKEGLEWMTNEVINFLNTLIGAAIAMSAGKYFLGM